MFAQCRRNNSVAGRQRRTAVGSGYRAGVDYVLDYLLTEPLPAAPADVEQAWARHRATSSRFVRPVDAAVAGGFGADRIGYAFLSGYQEALRALLPGRPADELIALCATEEGGAHPSVIRTTLTEADGNWSVTGTKSFATLGKLAQRFLVIASSGQTDDGRNRLHAALVDAQRPDVHLTNLPATPFAPEMSHATVTFAGTPAQLLPGDGYLDYLKPFRTIEDVHVLAAMLGWFVRVAREADWPPSMLQKLLVGVTILRGLDLDRPLSAGGHIALGGAYEYFEQLLTEADPYWELVDAATRQRWERDRPLLATAGRARAQRLATAWRTVARD